MPSAPATLSGDERERPVGRAREVVLERAPVDPRRAVAGSEDHARDRGLALAGAAVLGDLCHRSSSLQRLRGLRRVRVLRARVDLELAHLRGGEPVLREHALDRLADHLGRAPLELLAQRPLLEAARVAGVPAVHLLVELLARDADLLRVDDDHEVARVDVRRVLRLALPAERVGDLASRDGPGSCPRRRRRTSRAGSRPAWRCRWSSLGKSGSRADRRRRSVAAHTGRRPATADARCSR